nr:hypothetical protein Iba_chr04dCG10760 [Ipomoea batatas]
MKFKFFGVQNQKSVSKVDARNGTLSCLSNLSSHLCMESTYDYMISRLDLYSTLQLKSCHFVRKQESRVPSLET